MRFVEKGVQIESDVRGGERTMSFEECWLLPNVTSAGWMASCYVWAFAMSGCVCVEIANARRDIEPAGWLGVVVGVVDGLGEKSARVQRLWDGFFIYAVCCAHP